MNILQSLLVTGGTIAGSLLTALYFFQEKLLYHPTLLTREYEQNPEDYSMRYVDADIVTEDGVRLHAWLILQPQSLSAATFLYFHGNAGNISHRFVSYMLSSPLIFTLSYTHTLTSFHYTDACKP